jgi:ATP-dependent exoDNAse (exonuclease V) beta subunit
MRLSGEGLVNKLNTLYVAFTRAEESFIFGGVEQERQFPLI